MNILVINAGSSSLKYQLIDTENERVLAKGVYERIGEPDAELNHQQSHGYFKKKEFAKNHEEAVEKVLEMLTDSRTGVIKDMNEIGAVGHRIVHGGEMFSQSQLLDGKVLAALKENAALAPLHNPANIMGIEASRKHMPNICMVGVFDTAYHQTIPPKAYLYAIPLEAYKKHKIRRYGFHGTSHHYVADRAGQILGKDITQLRIVSCHLGNGASVAAIQNGRVIDTSMGFTPLEGVAMGTRSGDIDPTVVQYLMDKTDMTLTQTMAYLNHQSGVLGISGISSDFRDLSEAAQQGDKNAALAIDVFCYRVKKYIGAYVAAMGGVDVIVFTAGIGENAPGIRSQIIEGMEFLDIRLDSEMNDSRGQEVIISDAQSKVSVMVIPTNEELMIARETRRVYEEAAVAKHAVNG